MHEQPDASTPVDAGTTSDAGTVDAGTPDAGTVDAGTSDAGATDAGATDAGATDSGIDAGMLDAGLDAGVDAGVAICTPAATVSCYEGPIGTQGVGRCMGGTKTCAADGFSFSTCAGQFTPQTERCGNSLDDDCDGQTDEGCVCTPGATVSCYSGPNLTLGVGRCAAGTNTCNSTGTALLGCMGEVTPAATETCGNTIDDDCDGLTDEAGCTQVVTYSGTAQAIFQAKCAPCHTGGGSGGHNMGTSYADTQLSSYYCMGLTKGACALVRIQDGSMPAGAGCDTNPSGAACVTPAQQAQLQAWITGGQLP